MSRSENDRLVKDDRGNSFLYWGPSVGREGESSGVDPKTMGISNIPGEPAGVAIILKEPGKADADDVTKMFPKDGNIGEAGYEAPRESHNVAYNHEWWTCLCDEGKKKRHIEVCCKNGRDGGYKGRCARYRNHFRNLCSLVSPAVYASSDDDAFLEHVFLANLRYPSEPGAVGFSLESSCYKKMSEAEKADRFLGLVRWMRDYSRGKCEVGAGKELEYVFVQADLYEGLMGHLGIPENRSRECVAYVNKTHGAFYLEEFDVWVIGDYHPLARCRLDLEKSRENFEAMKSDSISAMKAD